jgi:tRNA threonylcarbamoyladenosine biosynthesis protein TsaB
LALILNIDTATENASICLSQNGNVIAFEESMQQKNHASFLQPAIQQALKQSSININQLDAVAVTNGPGSYTGLRVGLSSAKGICYAIDKPLITLNTLEVMAEAMEKAAKTLIPANNSLPVLYCPMIDARRMEVFTAVYTTAKKVQIQPCAMVLNSESFSDLLTENLIFFSGSGHAKLKSVLKYNNALFATTIYAAQDMVTLAEAAFAVKALASLAYSEPFYGKEFYSTAPLKK